MKGRNTLQINQATLVEAVQYWLDREMKTAPKVLSVKHNSKYIGADVFDVEVDSAAEDTI